MKILKPQGGRQALDIAAQQFQELYLKCTGFVLPIIEEPEDGDLVVLGADDVNTYAGWALLKGWLPGYGIRYGTDDYSMISVSRPTGDILFLAGGRGRSTIYAVYDFFARRAGCRYFWDGDITPKQSSIDITGLYVTQSPRYGMRGLRYFAHRGLHRFQAEHWGLEDWKREIDWMLKKRLNFFMLRIGLDDLFQKAFPSEVDYPSVDGALEEAGEGFDDRTLFWPLQFRGKLRKQLLEYAFARDLLHPEDCGTMTHWYSRTPKQFLEKVKPDFMPQVTDVYREETGMVWDITKDKNMNRYFALTNTHIREYGRHDIFHTIGLAERMCAVNREENLRYKKLTYHKIISKLTAEYPGAPLLLASWDFAMNWRPDEVRSLLAELDPQRHIIFDYTADTVDGDNNFQNWGFKNAFPWIFGIFHAYAPGSDLRGDYEELTAKLEQVNEDPYCKGIAFWPELSHSDPLMLEFFTRCSWDGRVPEEPIKSFCLDRYGEYAELLASAWQAYYPLLPLNPWTLDRDFNMVDMYQEYCFDILGFKPLHCFHERKVKQWREKIKKIDMVRTAAFETLSILSSLDDEALNQPFVLRDAIDLARSALGRILHWQVMDIILQAVDNASPDVISEKGNLCVQLLELLGKLLCFHEDYSLYATLMRLKKEHPVNPSFETAYKRNVSCGYCRSYVRELVEDVYIEECKIYFDWLARHVYREKNPQELYEARQRIFEAFLAKELVYREPAQGGAAWRALIERILLSEYFLNTPK